MNEATARKTRNTLKAAALATTAGAAINLGLQLSQAIYSPISITLTLLAAVLAGVALAGDITTAFRQTTTRITTWRTHRAAAKFRRRHGDMAGWDDNEYEAYFALTAHTTRPTRLAA